MARRNCWRQDLQRVCRSARGKTRRAMMTRWAIMNRTTVLLCMILMNIDASAAEDECSNAALMKLATRNYEHRVWGTLLEYRAAMSQCDGQSTYYYNSLRSQLESFAGNHLSALDYASANTYASRVRRNGAEFRVTELPEAAAATPATEYVISRAGDHRIVVVNERHHATNDRLLTMELLLALAEKGFRYLAIEALWWQDPINERGFPVGQTGWYINDVAFAEMLRVAIGAGYRLIPYEIRPEQRSGPRGNDREYWQARNIVEAVFDDDVDARLLVHCGYDHALELRRSRRQPMAAHLHQMSTYDPLTIDQTTLAEEAAVEVTHPLRIEAQSRGLLTDEPVVLTDESGAAVGSGRQFDISVFGAVTRYFNGRPHWMSMGGRRKAVAVSTPECADEPCMVEVLTAAQPSALPVDCMEAKGVSNVVYIPISPGDWVLRTYRLDGELLATRPLEKESTEL